VEEQIDHRTMSSRQMKRALADNLSSLADANSVESAAPSLPQRQRPAAFAFSNSDTSSDSESSSSEEDEASEEPAPPAPTPPNTTTTSKHKKKSNTTVSYNEATFLEQAAERARKETIERAMAQESNHEQQEQLLKYTMFGVNPRDFSVELELKRKFGSAAVANAESQSTNNHGRRRGRFQARGAKRTHQKKKTFLVKSDPNWPPPPSLQSGGLGMVVSEGTTQKYQEGCTYYRFESSNEMSLINLEYQQRVQTHDPNQIQQHVQAHPFHPPGLWRMSKIYSATGQHDASAMLLRRCIYVYECGFHLSFLKQAKQGKRHVLGKC
jgi:hypothetical protein